MGARYIPNPASVQERRYIVQVPRKRPTCQNAYTDKLGRVWIKATDYNEGNFTHWEEQPENTYYVWFNAETIPETDEVVFEQFKIYNMYRVGRLLRAVVELINI